MATFGVARTKESCTSLAAHDVGGVSEPTYGRKVALQKRDLIGGHLQGNAPSGGVWLNAHYWVWLESTLTVQTYVIDRPLEGPMRQDCNIPPIIRMSVLSMDTTDEPVRAVCDARSACPGSSLSHVALGVLLNKEATKPFLASLLLDSTIRSAAATASRTPAKSGDKSP